MSRESWVAAAVGVALICLTSTASAGFFTVPTNDEVFLIPAGGSAGGVTEFGLGTSLSNAQPVFTGLPNDPVPDKAVSIGSFAAGSQLDFYMTTAFGGTTGSAFSSDTVDAASRTAFMDLDNSLGLGGSVIEKTGSNVWRLHLDDALSFDLDDDDNDVLIDIQVGAAPPPTGIPLPAAASAAACCVPAFAVLYRRIRRSQMVGGRFS